MTNPDRLAPFVLDGMDRARLTERRRAGLAYLLAARARAGRPEAALFLEEARGHFSYAARWILVERRYRQIATMQDGEPKAEPSVAAAVESLPLFGDVDR